ncbi:MAG: peptidoglycan editing factor PgeF [Pseudomonadota bacterium]
MDTPFHTHPSLVSERIAHGFFGRAGGVSTGLYRGLNCGAGSRDDQTHIAENRARVARALGGTPTALCTLYQIHSPDVVIVHAPFDGPAPQADALVTNTPGLVLGILTADCTPVLFADAQAGVIGAAHAGWKGAHGGVLENTLAAMETLGARRADITAAIGPTIAQASYEVGPEFIARFAPAEQQQFFRPSMRAGHHQFDLPAYVVHRLTHAGVQQLATLGMDTCSDRECFFSYRRATLAGEADYGRQLSAIVLRVD